MSRSTSKWAIYNKEIDTFLESGETSYSKIARKILESNNNCSDSNVDLLRTYVKRRFNKTSGVDSVKVKSKTKTKPNDYDKPIFTLSAWSKDGTIMSIDEYCEHHGLPREDITSYKLITHSKEPYYNTVFRERVGDDIHEWNSAILSAKKDMINYFRGLESSPVLRNGVGEAVVKISDIHFGALTEGLKRTEDFSVKIVLEKLMKIPTIVNRHNFKKVHVHIHGDLIESFTGLNHVNSWKGVEKDMYGANVIKLCTEVISNMLSNINNLGAVKINGGNHDRVTSNNTEDVKAEAADLISWGLTMIGYDVEFDPLVIRHVVDGICFINLHGDKGISKKSTKDIVWDYGIQGKFNFVCEGHLHSRMQKAQAKKGVERVDLILDDSIDTRRQVLPAIFTGNYYSESLGYTSTSGFLIIHDSGNGIPAVLDYPI